MGLDTRKKTILLMGGGDGLIGDIKSVQQTILNLKPKLSIQLLVVCGSNRTLYFDFENLAAKSKVLIKSYGYVENIEELMTAADLLITKGGALTITEAMTRALPIIVYKPVPGHESGNASFVENSGAGIIVNSEDGLEKTIEYLLTNQEGLEKMSNSAKKIVPRETAIKAVRRSLEIVTKHNIVAANQSWKTG